MKVYTVAEALAKSDEAEKAGLIHEGPGNAAVMPGVLCSCAADCCGMLISSQASGEDMHALYTPAGLYRLSTRRNAPAARPAWRIAHSAPSRW